MKWLLATGYTVVSPDQTHPFCPREYLEPAQPALVLTQEALLLGAHIWTHPHKGATLMHGLSLDLGLPHLLVTLLQSVVKVLGCWPLGVGGEGQGGQEED